ncbi:MAG: MFS transporter [Hyphomonadaceae bacterium]|nr:MFS transporter [Hyphomonadaceae bacterium]
MTEAALATKAHPDSRPMDARYARRLIVILTITFGIVFFDRNAMNFLAPFVAAELHLNNTQISALTAVLALTWAISGLVVGRVADVGGRRKVILIACVVLFAVSSFLSGLATSFIMLAGARLLMGASEGGVLPVSQTFVALETSERSRGLFMGLVQNFGTHLLGSFAAPLILVAIAEAWGWRPAFFVAGVPGLVCAILIAIFVREPARSGEALQASDSTGISIRQALSSRNLFVCVALATLMICWIALGWIFYPLYMTQIRAFTPTAMSVQMSVLGLSAVAGSFLIPGLSDRLGRKPVLAVCCAIGIACPLAALYFQGSFWALAAIIAAGWLCASGTFPLFISIVPSESVPASAMATAIGLMLGVGEVFGGFLGPIGAGMSADKFGLAAPLWIQFALALAAGLLALFLLETAPIAKARAPKP